MILDQTEERKSRSIELLEGLISLKYMLCLKAFSTAFTDSQHKSLSVRQFKVARLSQRVLVMPTSTLYIVGAMQITAI